MTAEPNEDTEERTVRVAFGADERAPSGQGLAGGVTVEGDPLEVAITNDDETPPAPLAGPLTLSIQDARGYESYLYGGVLEFAVTLSRVSSEKVTVFYATGDVTATESVDYYGAWNELVFQPGETRKTVLVYVIDDGKAEGDETLAMYLYFPSGATIADDTTAGTIIDDD